MNLNLKKWFGLRKPSEPEAENMDTLRTRYLELAESVERLCPQNPDRTVAIRKLKESMHVAIGSIVCSDAWE